MIQLELYLCETKPKQSQTLYFYYMQNPLLILLDIGYYWGPLILALNKKVWPMNVSSIKQRKEKKICACEKACQRTKGQVPPKMRHEGRNWLSATVSCRGQSGYCWLSGWQSIEQGRTEWKTTSGKAAKVFSWAFQSHLGGSTMWLWLPPPPIGLKPKPCTLSLGHSITHLRRGAIVDAYN